MKPPQQVIQVIRLFLLRDAKLEGLAPFSENRHGDGAFAEVVHLRPLREACGGLAVVGTLGHNLQEAFGLRWRCFVIVVQQAASQVLVAYLPVV